MIIRYFYKCERAATAIEYGLIAALIALALVGSLSALGGGTDGMWTMVEGRVTAELDN